MSSAPSSTINWLSATHVEIVDSVEEVEEIFHGDYDLERANRLFFTIEHRLAQVVLYFDDIPGDARLIDSIISELNFLRAVWGEIRVCTVEVAPVSLFLRTLQNYIDRDNWRNASEIRDLAATALMSDGADDVKLLSPDEFPIIEWWIALPSTVADIPETWGGFDIAYEIFQDVYDQIEPDDYRTFMDTVNSLDESLRTICNDIYILNGKIEWIEEETAAKMAEAGLTPSNDEDMA